jgi:hypothetical protein
MVGRRAITAVLADDVRQSTRWRRAAALSAASMSIWSCLQPSLQNAASPLRAFTSVMG